MFEDNATRPLARAETIASRGYLDRKFLERRATGDTTNSIALRSTSGCHERGTKMFGYLMKLHSTSTSPRRGQSVRRRTRYRMTLLATISALVLSAGCDFNRSGSSIATSFEVKPTYLCESEEVLVSWSVPADRLDTVTTLLTRAPGGIVEIPDCCGR